jgi:hypothetical protein
VASASFSTKTRNFRKKEPPSNPYLLAFTDADVIVAPVLKADVRADVLVLELL